VQRWEAEYSSILFSHTAVVVLHYEIDIWMCFLKLQWNYRQNLLSSPNPSEYWLPLLINTFKDNLNNPLYRKTDYQNLLRTLLFCIICLFHHRKYNLNIFRQFASNYLKKTNQSSFTFTISLIIFKMAK